AERRRLRHGRRGFRRQAGDRYQVRQYPFGLSSVRRPQRRGAAEDGGSAGNYSQGLAQRAVQPRGEVLELSRNNAVPKTGAAAASTGLGRRHLGADSGVGWSQRLRHYDGRSSASTGKSAAGRRGMEKGVNPKRH